MEGENSRFSCSSHHPGWLVTILLSPFPSNLHPVHLEFAAHNTYVIKSCYIQFCNEISKYELLANLTYCFWHSTFTIVTKRGLAIDCIVIPLHMRYQDRIVQMWVWTNKLPSHHLLNKIYHESMRLGQLGHNTWAGRVEHIINKYTVDLPNRNVQLLHNKDFDRINNQMRELRYNQFIQMWKLDLHKNNRWPKLDMYKFIKNDYCIEPHILYVKNKNHQRALTRLRLSAHKLDFEIGRHRRPYIPRHQRLCLYCNCGEIADEIYFILKCNFHTEARHSLFKLIASYLP